MRNQMNQKLTQMLKEKEQSILAMQMQQEQQHREQTDQMNAFNNALSQNLSSVTEKFVAGLHSLSGKVISLESKLKQTEEKNKE